METDVDYRICETNYNTISTRIQDLQPGDICIAKVGKITMPHFFIVDIKGHVIRIKQFNVVPNPLRPTELYSQHYIDASHRNMKLYLLRRPIPTLTHLCCQIIDQYKIPMLPHQMEVYHVEKMI
jgi:hypothetical protein